MSKVKTMSDTQPQPTTLLDVMPPLTIDEYVRAQTELHCTMREAAQRHRDAGETDMAVRKDFFTPP